MKSVTIRYKREEGVPTLLFFKNDEVYFRKSFETEYDAYEAAGFYEKFYSIIGVTVKDVIL